MTRLGEVKTMALMSWMDSYSVSVPQFDSQHKQLFALINRLHDAMAKGHANDVMAKTLDELILYTKSHFQAEEKLLESKGYPDLAAHKAQHEKFTSQVVQFQEDFISGKLTVTIQLMNFLRDWLIHHILETDKQYGEFLKQRQKEKAQGA
jgi:hemerythrin